VRLISKDRDGDTLNEHGVVSLPTLSRMPSAMSKTESWNIPKRNRGAEHIPHGVLGSLRDSYIVDMMVYGVPGDFVANNPSRFQITSSDMLKHQFERTMDFFFGLIYALNQYLAECRKVRKSLEQKDREACGDGSNDSLIAMVQAFDPSDKDLAASGCGGNPGAWADSRLRMLVHSSASLQVTVEILPKHSNTRLVHRERYYAAIVAPQGSHCDLTWDVVLGKMRETNVRRKLQEEATIAKNNGRDRAPPVQLLSAAEQIVNGTASDRPMHSDEYTSGTEGWVLVALAHVNTDNPVTRGWTSTEAMKACQTDGKHGTINPAVGPWSKEFQENECLTPSALVSNVFSLGIEFARCSYAGNPVSKYPEQSDFRYYMPEMCMKPNNELRTHRECHEAFHAQEKPLQPYCTTGWHFTRLPPLVRDECVFFLDPDQCFSTPRSYLNKSSIGNWWARVDLKQQKGRLESCGGLASAEYGLPNPLLGNYAQNLAVGLNDVQDIACANIGKEHIIPQISYLVTPMHEMKDDTNAQRDYHDDTVAKLRQGDTNVTSYEPMHTIYADKSSVLLTGIPERSGTCDSTRQMAQWLSDEANGYVGSGKREGKPATLQRMIHRNIKAPDMETADNVMQEMLLKFEQLDISTVHGPMYIVLMAALDSMYPHKKMYLNVSMYGLGEAGKSRLLDTIKLCMVPGTFIEVEHKSELADLSQEPSQYHAVHVYHEMPDALIQDKGKVKQTGVKALSIEKGKLTEGKLGAQTAGIYNGDRRTIHLKKWFAGAHIYNSNMETPDQLAEAFVTRILPFIVPLVFRPDRSATDKNAHNTLQKASARRQGGADIVSMIKTYFKHMQCTVFLIGTLIEFAGMMLVDMTAFAFVSKRVDIALHSLGMRLTPRTVERGQVIASTMTFAAMHHEEFATPHGRYASTDRDFAARDLFDSQHTWEMELICSESSARSALQSVLTGFRKGSVAKIAQALMHIIKTSGVPYSEMLSAVAPSTTGVRKDPTAPCVLDLNYVRFNVGTSSTGLIDFCARVVEALSVTTGSKITASQVEDIIKHLGSHPAWYLTEHTTMDVRLTNVGNSTTTWEEEARYTYLGYMDKSKVRGHAPDIPAAYIDGTKALWKRSRHAMTTGTFNDFLWPAETHDDRVTETRTVSLDTRRTDGCILFSIAFLNRASQPGFVEKFDKELNHALNTSHTTERYIATPPVDMLEMDPCYPYLVTVEKTKCTDVTGKMANQTFVSRAHFGNVNGDRDRDPSQCREEILFEHNVPLDTIVAVNRVSNGWRMYPFVKPTAYQMLRADKTGPCARFGPHVLDLMLRQCPEFRDAGAKVDGQVPATNELFETRKVLVCAFLQRWFPDFLRHFDEFDHQMEHTNEADAVCEQYTYKLAHKITGMSIAKHAGALREKALSIDDGGQHTKDITVAREMIRLKRAHGGSLEGVEPSIKIDDDGGSVWQLMYHADERTIKAYIVDLQKSIRNISIAKAKNGLKTTFKSFIDEWRSFKKPGVHDGAAYVAHIRRMAKLALSRRRASDSEWMKRLGVGEYAQPVPTTADEADDSDGPSESDGRN
jgi:hypothetical protein